MNLTGYFGADAVQGYGCVQCQEWHYEGDAKFAPHIYWQSKHGIQSVKPPVSLAPQRRESPE
jgi:hypothetical protein